MTDYPVTDYLGQLGAAVLAAAVLWWLRLARIRLMVWAGGLITMLALAGGFLLAENLMQH